MKAKEGLEQAGKLSSIHFDNQCEYKSVCVLKEYLPTKALFKPVTEYDTEAQRQKNRKVRNKRRAVVWMHTIRQKYYWHTR
jgi:hypothetical protein